MTALQILTNHSLKKTSSRVAIIEALQCRTMPMAESEIKVKMGKLYERITFYRNINAMLEAGILHRIVANNTTVRYALNNCEGSHNHRTEHVHFFCQKCSSITCLKETKNGSYVLPEGFIGEECEVIIKGICNKCSGTVDNGVHKNNRYSDSFPIA